MYTNFCQDVCCRYFYIHLYTYIFIYSIYVCAACEMRCAFNFILLHFTFTNSACATLFYRKYAPQIHTGNTHTHIVTICNYSVCVFVCVCLRGRPTKLTPSWNFYCPSPLSEQKLRIHLTSERL